MDSIIQHEKKCYLTGARYSLDKHHIMNGTANRKKADEDGLWIWLRHDVHMWLHQTHNGQDKDKQLKAIAQATYEESHTHEEWMARYHKNYIERQDDE
jgi:hypothetical protein